MIGLWRVLFALATVGIVAVSLLPVGSVPAVAGISDHLQHGVAYLVLMSLGAAAFAGARVQAWIAMALIALGATLELAQSAVPGRYPEMLDAVGNGAGVLAGLAAAALGRRRRLAAGAASNSGPEALYKGRRETDYGDKRRTE